MAAVPSNELSHLALPLGVLHTLDVQTHHPQRLLLDVLFELRMEGFSSPSKEFLPLRGSGLFHSSIWIKGCAHVRGGSKGILPSLRGYFRLEVLLEGHVLISFLLDRLMPHFLNLNIVLIILEGTGGIELGI